MSAGTPPSSSAEATRIVAGPPGFNEAFADDGLPRPHWRALLDILDAQGPEAFAVRAENGRRILREHGVTCGTGAGSDAPERPWELDFLPLVLPAGEWRALAAGVAQRARLLNAVLGDLYGVQRLVRDGFLPAPLVFANPGYLRACQALPVKDGVYLQTYAADLARAPDGGWRVLADRTQAPAGIGFAQEARTVTARVLPEAIRALQPCSLAATLNTRRDTLRALAAQRADNPAIVLLSPGPRNETYFEHAYVARLLGFALVEGEDLTVRDRRVCVKTLEGLRPVDVILRRVSDAFCDPLELRGDSLLGVPGLVEAARAGRVAIANALGTGLLESPAFLPFLPGLCRHLLEEDLRLPSVATWWCGQPRECSQVRERLDELVLGPAFALARPGCLDPIGPTDLAARPLECVGQEGIRLGRVPVANGGAFIPRSFVLRVFVIYDGARFAVMPGGLCFVGDADAAGSAAFSPASLCKDVWVLPEGPSAEEPVQSIHLPAAGGERAAADLPSRTADNFFWLGRYAERLEHLGRIARCVVGRLADDTGPGSEPRLAALAELLAGLGVLPALAGDRRRDALQKEILLLLHKDGRAGGVRDLLKRIHLSAFTVRYRLSADTWRILNRLEPDARQRPDRLPLVQTAAMLNTLILDLAAFSGMEMENMTRGHGWAFLDFGRRIERGLGLARLLETLVGRRDQLDLLFEPVLEIADSVMTYRQRHFAQPRLDSLLGLLLLEGANPRSLAFQVARLAEHAAGLPAGLNAQGVAGIRQRVANLAARLEGRAPAVWAEPGGSEETRAWLAHCGTGLLEISDLLTQVFFSHVQPRVN